MLIEKEILIRAIKWRVIGIVNEYEGIDKQKTGFIKSNAYKDVLNWGYHATKTNPIKNRDNIDGYSEKLANMFINSYNVGESINEFLTSNIDVSYFNL